MMITQAFLLAVGIIGLGVSAQNEGFTTESYHSSDFDPTTESISDFTSDRYTPYTTGVNATLPGLICSSAQIPHIENAIYIPVDTLVGDGFTYSCVSGYRVAPADHINDPPTEITIWCEKKGRFSEPEGECVNVHPKSCQDFYDRDDLFHSCAVSTCTEVTLDVEGESCFSVQCCKKSDTEISTNIPVTSGAQFSNPILSYEACAYTTSSVLPTTVFSAGVCLGTSHTVTYPISAAQIKSVVSSVCGECKQVTSISCAGGVQGISLALQTQAEPHSGYLYGTNGFPSSIVVDHYTYAGQNCDCADLYPASNTPDPADVDSYNACIGGCACSSNGTSTGTSDTITKYLTSNNLPYVTMYELTKHGLGTSAPANSYSVTVGDIVCCEKYDE